MPLAFLTGGTGFVGSHLAEALLAQGYTVRCLVRKDLKWLNGLPIEPVWGRVDDKDALAAACKDVDEVYHVAGLTRSKHWSDFLAANVDATTRLLDILRQTAPQVRKIVVTSSQAASGPSETPLSENARMQPLSQYGKSKALMEEAIKPYLRDLPITIVRPPSVYGPREADIFTFIQSVNRGFCPIVGDGRAPQLNLVYVRDLVAGMIQAAQSDCTSGETYFLGSEDYSWHQIRDAVAHALQKKTFTLHIPVGLVAPLGALLETVAGWFGQYPPLNREKAKEAQHAWRLSIQKARDHFGYHPATPLHQGMKETVEWYRAHKWL
ncbi:MAG: NAD-dependent epimerase/dehydratase family protein [Bacteroidetes Order II. Incertae sedis bacterium]|nr:NAD-dependent epimerase/dehydratase family protein [Bacteroidetes Order II. bacterium]